MVINKTYHSNVPNYFLELHVNQTNDALMEDRNTKILKSEFTEYQGKVLADGPKFTKRAVTQELWKEYRYVQVYFYNTSFHISPVNISPYRVKNEAYRLCLE